MTVADPASAEQAERPVLGGAERAGLRVQVQAEIARRRPKPVAVRTLELLAEAAVEPSEGPPGYRVVDRHGRPRLHPGSDAPLTLPELVDDLQRRHPALFPPPDVVVAPATPEAPEKDSALMAGAAEMRAATVRFVETGSERARALAERSTEQGRALAESAAGRVSGFRARLAARLAARRARASGWGGAAAGLGRRLAGVRNWQGEGESVRQHRRWLAGGTAAVLLAVAAAGLVVASRIPEGETAAPLPAVKPVPAPRPAPPPEAAAAPPETAEATDLPEPPPAPNEVRGRAEVIDTATVRVSGKLMRLFGVEWVRGGQADELTKYLAGRPVACVPAPGSENFSCTVEGRDLSEVVLFNGGGRAAPEASPELVAAEDHARTERIGVWKR
ncbi:thermonuclease family protein [uncultured Methylobacterium sp.]|uniref:thermonuclease family protein n=1 Tax=uncultured Methylobacterium sp. TaxID=157278 RepID=UPI0035C9A56F